jgi:AcrR family transcriptional regulator
MKRTRSTLKEKIIIATIECIEKTGIQAVTVRDIAKQAGVNIAAVSYYFGSKENLLSEALRFSLYSTLNQNIEEVLRTNPTPEQMLKAIFKDFFQGALNFPNLTKAHIYGPFVNGGNDGIIIEWLNDLASRLAAKIEGSGHLNIDSEKLKMALVQMISNMLFWSLFPDMFNNFLAVDFRDPIQQDKFIDLLLERYLGDG